MPYCTSADLLFDPQLGLPTGMNRDQYVQYGADQIDMKLGRIYKTPIVFETTKEQAQYSATLQLLKVVNQHISSGMLINALSLSGEESTPNAYGTYLIAQGQMVLDQIVAGDVFLEGATPNKEAEAEDPSSKPRVAIFNYDERSAVEAFYDKVWGPTGEVVSPGNLFGQRSG